MNLGPAAEMAHELGQAAGGEVLHSQAAVPLGHLHPRRQAQGAEAAQPQARVPIRMALLLAGVGGHGPLQRLALRAHVHQQVGIGGVVDLVEEDARAAERLLVRMAVAQGVEQAVDGGEGGPVVARDLQGGGDEQQLGSLRQDRPPDPLRRCVEIVLQGAVGKVEVVAAGEPQDLAGLAGLFPPAPAVGGAVRHRLRSPAAVGEEEDAHGAARRGELGREAAAAQHLVVVMGGEHEGAGGAHALGPARRLERSVHWMYPRARSRFSVSGSTAPAAGARRAPGCQRRSAGFRRSGRSPRPDRI